MSELKVYHCNEWHNEYTEFYLKSEADKVFAELEERHKMEVEQLLIEIAELQKQVRDYAQGLYVIQARAEKEARHHKYKRCLAMARWCERKRIDAANYRIPRQKWDFYDKWHKRWLELAEEHTWAKFLQLIRKEAK